jgi:hypothetical protein
MKKPFATCVVAAVAISNASSRPAARDPKPTIRAIGATPSTTSAVAANGAGNPSVPVIHWSVALKP